jgi:hypothetical protein
MCVGVLCAVAGPAAARAAADGATGKLRIGEQEFVLNNVFAVMEQDLMGGGDKDKLTVLLTDAPVPEELRNASAEWFNWADKQARAGALHGLILTINPATGVWDRGQLLTHDGLMFYTESSSSSEESRLNFSAEGPIGEQAGGKVRMRESMQTMQDDRWSVEAEFHTAVIPRPAMTATLTGAAALSSLQYKALQTFLEACRKGNVDGIRAAVDPHSLESLEAMIASNKQEALKMFAGMAAETAALKLSRIIVRGDSAELQFLDPTKAADTKQSLRLVRVDGAWKVAQ